MEGAHVCVELPHEAGEIVVLEELAQQLPGEVLVLPDREAARNMQGLVGGARVKHTVHGQNLQNNLRDNLQDGHDVCSDALCDTWSDCICKSGDRMICRSPALS